MKRTWTGAALLFGRCGKRAVTLVEVTVCFVAVTALVGWLIPATTGVGQNRKQSKCLSNLARIGYANTIYAAQDPANMAIPVHPAFFEDDPYYPICVGPYEWGGKSGKGETDFVTGTPGDLVNSRYGTQAGFGPATRPLNRILYREPFADYTNDPGEDNENWIGDTQLELDVYHCPSDSGYTGIHSPAFRDERLTSFDHFGTSYGANMFMTASTGGGYQFSNSPFLHRMSDIISPATTLAYQENNGRFAWAARPDPCDFIDGISGTVRGWHGKDWTFSAAFIDGHADMIHMQTYASEDIGVYPGGVTYTSYRCIILRGKGWQKDTLPTPRVQTALVMPAGETRASYERGIE